MVLEVFTSKGTLRPADSYTEAELAELSGERLQRFNELRLAGAECEAAEADLKQSQLNVEACVVAEREAREALNRLRPPKQFMDLWREMRATRG